MRRRLVSFALPLLLLAPFHALADGRLSTYLEGTLIRKTDREWVVTTEDGTYWVSLDRPPSWRRQLPGGQISFWVQVKQIRRWRPRPPPHVPESPLRDPDADTAIAMSTVD